MIKEDILEKLLKIVFLKTKILSFGVYLNQKKMYLEGYFFDINTKN